MLLQIIQVLYVLIAVSMIGLILMQRGAGAQAGSGFGGVLFSKPLATLLATQGWRAGFRLNAIICLVTAVVVLLLIRKSPSEMGQQPYTDGKTKAAGGAAGWAGLAKSEAVKTGAF